MKTSIKHLAIALAATLQLAAIAAVPLAWDVRPDQPAPVMFDRYHGETLSFAATFRGFGELPFAPGADIRLWYQTNGMGSAWWSAPATIQSNVLSATWSPALDPGADRVSLFFGAPSNAYASAVLRLRQSPGFAPGAMPDPESFHESDPAFAEWLNTNQVIAGGPYLSVTGGEMRIARGMSGITMRGSGPSLGGLQTTSWMSPGRFGIGPTMVNFGMEIAGDWLDFWHWFSPGRLRIRFPVDGNEWMADESGYPVEGGTLALRSDIPPSVSNVVTKSYVESLGIASEEEDPVWSAEKSGYAAKSDLLPIGQDIADLRTESSLVYRLYSGSNVVAEVTNYNSQVHAPSLRLMQLNESNEYVTVWTETNGLARTLRDATNYADRAIADYAAPRAWSRTTSGLGFDAPDGMTWVSSSNLVIAGGLEYEKHVTSCGAIWLLESNGMTADFHASNNNTAYLDISAADGTSIFRIEKTDSYLVGVNVNSVSVDGSTLVCGVNVVASEHPLVRVKAQLSDASWSKEEDGTTSGGVTTISGLASIAWSGTAGNWTCRITNLTGGNSLFAQMEYLQEGGTKIVNTAPLDVGQGILCTDGVHKCRAVYNNGTITWEPVP